MTPRERTRRNAHYQVHRLLRRAELGARLQHFVARQEERTREVLKDGRLARARLRLCDLLWERAVSQTVREFSTMGRHIHERTGEIQKLQRSRTRIARCGIHG